MNERLRTVPVIMIQIQLTSTNSIIISFLTDKCNQRCKNGTMCHVNDDDLPECPCPTECSDDADPHCSVFLVDYENLCKVHLHACKMQINVAVKHRGRCAGMGPVFLSDNFPPHTKEVCFLSLKNREQVTPEDGNKPLSNVTP